MKSMEVDMNKEHWDIGACPKVDCRKNNCKCGLKKVFLASVLGDDSKDSPIAPKNGEYCNAIVAYEANGNIYIYDAAGVPTLVEESVDDVKESVKALQASLDQEILDRQAADNVLQGEIDDIKNSPDVVDIVATYAALQEYDTSRLGDNDIVRVLQDEQHDGQSTYYRWNKQNSTWVYIGAVGDYYTKGQVDALLAGKQDDLTAGNNISITQVNDDLVISATDTTYSDFVGTDGNTGGTAGLVPAPATTDAGKFLKSDGTWDTAGGGIKELSTADYNYPENNPDRIALWLLEPGMYKMPPSGVSIYYSTNSAPYLPSTYGEFVIIEKNHSGIKPIVMYFFGSSDGIYFAVTSTSGVKQRGLTYTLLRDKVVQTTGTSQTDVMSQNATTSMVFADPSTAEKVQIGSSSSSSAYQSVAVGSASRVSSARGVAVGPQSYANASSSVAIGAGSVANIAGSVDVGCSRIGGIGYNSTDYRIITGVYDGQSIHDVATKGQLDSIAIQNAGAPTTSTVGTVGQLLQDTTNGKLYICTDATNPYVWEEVGAGGGGGPTVVQAIGTSTTDVMSQNAVTGLLFNSARKHRVQIGDSATTMSDYAISIGNSAYTNSIDQVSVGRNAGFGTSGQGTLCIGRDAKVTGDGGIALGAKSKATAKGEMNIGTTDSAYGYSSSNYRLLSGVYDGQSAHDAVTVNQVNATIDAINTALSTNIPHIGAST